jgi:transposase InsO family protein
MAGMSKSSYYYKPRQGKPGRKPSTHCLKSNQGLLTNDRVVDEMRNLLSMEFMENGYRKVTSELRDLGYHIGKTKTYRLMKENHLLLPRKSKRKRDFVRFTQPLPFEPFEKLEMDIKFIYIRGTRKNALLLTILDTFTRMALGWELQYSIRHTSVGHLFHQVIDSWLTDYRPPFNDEMSVTIRCDNDGRFVAYNLQNFLQQNFINQEFILPATPEQNAHIESFHSVVEQLVCRKYVFEDIHHAREVFARFFDTYNNRRVISSLQYLPPMIFFQQWQQENMGFILKKVRGKIKQTFFFRGQRPKWHSALSEDFCGVCNDKDNTENNTFVEPILNES